MDCRTAHILHEPALAALRHLAHDQIDAADRAAHRLEKDDPEALHDFRVALRRLRTLLKAYGDLKPIRKRERKRLRALARQTNGARDLEVVVGELRQFADGGEPAAATLVEKLAARQREALAETLGQVRARWPTLASRLRRSLDAERPLPPDPFIRFTARLVDEAWSTLQREQQALRTAWSNATAHRLRLAGKRLRYLLEPLAADLPETSGAVAALKSLQDGFGRHHDLSVLLGLVADAAADDAAATARAQVLGQPPPASDMPALLSLAARLHDEQRRLTQALQAAYLTDDTEPLAPVIHALAALHRAC